MNNNYLDDINIISYYFFNNKKFLYEKLLKDIYLKNRLDVLYSCSVDELDKYDGQDSIKTLLYSYGNENQSNIEQNLIEYQNEKYQDEQNKKDGEIDQSFIDSTYLNKRLFELQHFLSNTTIKYDFKDIFKEYLNSSKIEKSSDKELNLIKEFYEHTFKQSNLSINGVDYKDLIYNAYKLDIVIPINNKKQENINDYLKISILPEEIISINDYQNDYTKVDFIVFQKPLEYELIKYLKDKNLINNLTYNNLIDVENKIKFGEIVSDNFFYKYNNNLDLYKKDRQGSLIFKVWFSRKDLKIHVRINYSKNYYISEPRLYLSNTSMYLEDFNNNELCYYEQDMSFLKYIPLFKYSITSTNYSLQSPSSIISNVNENYITYLILSIKMNKNKLKSSFGVLYGINSSKGLGGGNNSEIGIQVNEDSENITVMQIDNMVDLNNSGFLRTPMDSYGNYGQLLQMFEQDSINKINEGIGYKPSSLAEASFEKSTPTYYDYKIYIENNAKNLLKQFLIMNYLKDYKNIKQIELESILAYINFVDIKVNTIEDDVFNKNQQIEATKAGASSNNNIDEASNQISKIQNN